jgi:hypothetical protein
MAMMLFLSFALVYILGVSTPFSFLEIRRSHVRF